MANDFNPEKAIEETTRVLAQAGVPADEAKRQATEQVNSMGATKILTGKCPRGDKSPMACMFCEYGHMTFCHHPLSCEEANCSHYQEEVEAEGYYPPEGEVP